MFIELIVKELPAAFIVQITFISHFFEKASLDKKHILAPLLENPRSQQINVLSHFSSNFPAHIIFTI
jgi:hypothetical protein